MAQPGIGRGLKSGRGWYDRSCCLACRGRSGLASSFMLVCQSDTFVRLTVLLFKCSDAFWSLLQHLFRHNLPILQQCNTTPPKTATPTCRTQLMAAVSDASVDDHGMTLGCFSLTHEKLKQLRHATYACDCTEDCSKSEFENDISHRSTSRHHGKIHAETDKNSLHHVLLQCTRSTKK